VLVIISSIVPKKFEVESFNVYFLLRGEFSIGKFEASYNIWCRNGFACSRDVYIS
jgi:hypothetical protein